MAESLQPRYAHVRHTSFCAPTTADGPRRTPLLHPLRNSFDTAGNFIARNRYPDDPREDLDHVLHRAGHARPVIWQKTSSRSRAHPGR